MEDGVERIVEQVVNPKIMSVIQPEVHIHFYFVKFNILVFLLCYDINISWSSIEYYGFRWKTWYVVGLTWRDQMEQAKQVKIYAY